MRARSSALHVTGIGSAFVADLYDCLSDLALSDLTLLALALDPPGWSAIVDTLAICAGLNAIVVGHWPSAMAPAFARADPASLPLREAAVDGVLLGAARFALQPTRSVLDEVRRVLRPGGRVLVASPTSSSPGDRHGRRHGVAWCRLLEELGFSVEKTVTTRAAPATSAARADDESGRIARLHSTSRTRDGLLAGGASESLIVQARRW